jgi:gluconate 2-dehydrogenase gamma chain
VVEQAENLLADAASCAQGARHVEPIHSTGDPMQNTPPTSRRALLKALALGVPTALGAARATAQPASTSPPAAPAPNATTAVRVAPPVSRVMRFFNAEEAAAMDAVVSHLIPADDLGPGAKEAGVTFFVDQQLAGSWGSGDHFYRQGPFEAGTPEQGYQLSFTPADMFRLGLRKLNETSGGKGFAALPAAEQDAMLKKMQAGELDFSPLPSAIFFQAVLDATMEGFFSDPIHGGNAGMAGWLLVGFPGAYASYANDIDRHGVAWTRPPVSIADAHAHHASGADAQPHGSTGGRP